MSESFIFIATNGLKQGKLKEERKRVPTSIQVYGTPSDTVLEMLRARAGSGVSLSVSRHHLGGFTRAQASRAVWCGRLALPGGSA